MSLGVKPCLKKGKRRLTEITIKFDDLLHRHSKLVLYTYKCHSSVSNQLYFTKNTNIQMLHPLVDHKEIQNSSNSSATLAYIDITQF